MNEITEAAYKYVNHDMILQHTTLPEFPELRTQLLRVFLNSGSGAQAEAARPLNDAVSLAVSLAQLGLDTHELVESSELQSRKQMTVLAGDYFSSRFYQLLSQAENVQSIGLLSHSICEVNRMKMGLYSKAKNLLLSAEEYIGTSVDVKTHLFLSFTSWMEGIFRRSWPFLIRTVAECELIIGELARVRPDNVKNSWSYWYMLQHGTPREIDLLLSDTIEAGDLQAMLRRHNVFAQLTHMLDTKLEELKQTLQGLGSERLANELSRIAEPLFEFGMKISARKVLKEI